MSTRVESSRGRGRGRGLSKSVSQYTRDDNPPLAQHGALVTMLEKAKVLGFDPNKPRPDGTRFANLDGARKFSILKTFLKNERRKGKGETSSSTVSPLGNNTVKGPEYWFRWEYLGSDEKPGFSPLTCDKSDIIVQFDELVDQHVLVTKFHVLLRARPGSDAVSPLASITAIDQVGEIKDDELVRVALNSKFAVKKLFSDDDTIGYRVSFTKPVLYSDIRKKIRFVISTSNVSTKQWLFIQKWIKVQQEITAPDFARDKYLEVNYTVE